MRLASRTLLALTVCLTLACASGAGGPATGGSGRNPNVITSEDIAQVNEATAYDVVQRLRPSFLQARSMGTPSTSGRRGSSGAAGVSVYVGDTRMGGTDYLQSIAATQVKEIRYYPAADATSKWGTGNSSGAIQVIMR